MDYQSPCWPSAGDERLLRAATSPRERAHAEWLSWTKDAGTDPLPRALARLRPLLWHNLRGLDDPRLRECAAAYRRTRYGNYLKIDALLPVVRGLEAAGVRVLLLKGWALIARVYGDPGLRPMGDVDVLVHPEDAGHAAAWLNEHGFTGRATAAQPLRPHSSPFSSLSGVIDLHEQALEDGWEPGVDEALRGGAERASLLGGPIAVPNPGDLLLLACAQADRWDWDTPYRWIPDAMAVLSSGAPIDWDRLVDQAVRRGLGPRIKDALAYLAQRLEAPVPAAVTARLERERTPMVDRLIRRARATAPDRRNLLEAAALHIGEYRRLVGKGAIRPGPGGLIGAVQRVWELPSPWAVPGHLLRRGVRRILVRSDRLRRPIE
jgi:hypothetical protein